MTHPAPNRLIQAATEYLAEGFNPLPLNADKTPMLPRGHTYLYDAVAEADLPALFSRAVKLGLVCGDVSGGLECIDFDGKAGQPIADVFGRYTSDPAVADIIARNDLPIVCTPSGGYHIYYRHTDRRQPSQRLAQWADGSVMIETRGHGGYVATVPSPGYDQQAGSSIHEIARIEQYERDTLLAAAESLSEYTPTTETQQGTGAWPEAFDTSTVWGRYNETESDEARAILTEQGWQFIRRRSDGCEYWQRPGKDARLPVTSATFGRRHNMFYVFSSSVKGLSPNTAYSPFDLFILYRHAGDRSAAIRALRDRYGAASPAPDPPPPAVEPPDEPPAPGRFPIDVFPPDVTRLITALNDALNYSTEFVSIAIMFTIATITGNRVKLKVKEEWIAPTIFWFAAVGETGTMKSHPINSILSPLKQIDRANKHIYDEEYDRYEAELAQVKRAKSSEPIRRPVFRQILINDITLESLHEVHSFNRRGLGLYRDELMGFLHDMNRYHKGSDEQFWLESFNNGSYTVNRVSKRPCMIEDTHINIIGTIQPTVFSQLAKNNSDNGMLERFLYTGTERTIHDMTKQTIDPRWMQWWGECIASANTTMYYMDSADTQILDTDEPTMDAIIDVDKRICATQRSEDTTDAIKNYLSKYKTYIPRFTLLMAIMDHIFTGAPLKVTPGHVHRADRIMQYFFNSARAIFSEADKAIEINEVVTARKGLTKSEQIAHLHSKGYRQIDIAKMVKVSKVYVSKIVNATHSSDANR